MPFRPSDLTKPNLQTQISNKIQIMMRSIKTQSCVIDMKQMSTTQKIRHKPTTETTAETTTERVKSIVFLVASHGYLKPLCFERSVSVVSLTLLSLASICAYGIQKPARAKQVLSVIYELGASHSGHFKIFGTGTATEDATCTRTESDTFVCVFEPLVEVHPVL